MTKEQRREQELNQQPGCLAAVFRLGWQFILRMFGIGRQGMRRTLEPMDQYYQEYVDSWVSENLARWLHQTRGDIDTAQATRVLLGEADRYPLVARQVRDTLIDAKVTFSQRSGKQYLEIEAYMAPRQTNGSI